MVGAAGWTLGIWKDMESGKICEKL